ncbi:hypothetical protein [Paenibacillus campinasensis]|uniref:hypothetical protein n=1 Tax=Paenibacillus campinasensis TaxID=66347 RepID=UPI0015CB96F7|nr:hypothetical protein [Paenibacillus campinasensis]
MKPRNRAMHLEIKQVIEKLGLTSDQVSEFYDVMKEKYGKGEKTSGSKPKPKGIPGI